ncbi:hypothetical protein ILUMI_24399 [Ignelater luminosus]|uniref:Uncharacterized protein n=1 Tax=Ignelater luminosus TaxID=2038154 RepID=A0A8K0FWL1_IGNLU|nr:hypothetical protein ILUMI_24399 [Ignelater luminosus]
MVSETRRIVIINLHAGIMFEARHVGRVLAPYGVVMDTASVTCNVDGYKQAGQGHERATSTLDDRLIQLSALRTRDCTAKTPQNQIQDTFVRDNEKLLKRSRAHIPATTPILTKELRLTILRFALECAGGLLRTESTFYSQINRENSLLMQDKARPHIRRVALEYCNGIGIDRLA